MTYIFSIEGNIGSGKSTFITFLKDNFKNVYNYKIIYLLEPVNDWESIKDENGKNIIENFYMDNKKYAFSFQMMAYISRLSQIKDCIKENDYKNIIIITERSVTCDRFVFAKMLYDDKVIDKINYEIYLKWFDSFIKDIKMQGLVYIKTSVDTCMNRIKIRNRKGENIPREYINKCNNYHNEYCNKFTCLYLDGDKDNKSELYYLWKDKLEKFIINKTKIKSMDFFPTLNDIKSHPLF